MPYDTEYLIQLDKAHVWHPFTQMRDWIAPDHEPLVLVAGHGPWLEDSLGKRYLDGNSSIWTNIHGHNHPTLNRAIGEQLAHVAHTSILGFTNPKAAELAKRLVAMLPGKHRDNLLAHVNQVIAFNRGHEGSRFDGIHLDIEPQQRPENKGAGNLGFLPNLMDAFRAVRAVAEPAQMTVNADIQNKLLKGDAAQRQRLLSSVPRLTLMMYELSSPGDGQTAQQKAEKAATASEKFLEMAYAGLPARGLARMAIALRTQDYGNLLPQMLRRLDEANRGNPRYLGWARHSYNDVIKGQ